MAYISVDNFIKQTNGKAYDFDKSYGVQCVDGIKVFNYMVYGDGADFTCGNNWAYGLWTCYETNGVKKYFDKYDYKDAKKGDWIIWNKGSKSAPSSHVAMFIEKVNNDLVKCYGQSQNGIKAFNTCNLWSEGILGVLRPKIYEEETKHVGNPVNRNEKIDQVFVKVPQLRARKEPSLKGAILGYINEGYYDIQDKKDADGYTWYKVQEMWIAYNKDWLDILPHEETKEEIQLAYKKRILEHIDEFLTKYIEK